MKLLITGADGQLGFEFTRILMQSGEHEFTAYNHQQCDITNEQAIARAIHETEPDFFINCAAYTNVDAAQEHSALCNTVNADALATIAKQCAKNNIPVIHFSTDYVFSGDSEVPYREDDRIQPLGVYGASKWQGEENLRNHLSQHLILRISWVNGLHGHNFLKTMLQLARERRELTVVHDQIGCPCFTHEIVSQTLGILPSLQQQELWGTYHFSQQPAVSWYDFAREIIQEARNYQDLAVEEVLAVTTEQYPTKATRPKYSVLANQKFTSTFSRDIAPWQEDMRRVIWEYLQ